MFVWSCKKTQVWAASNPICECSQTKVMCSNPGERGFTRFIKVSTLSGEASGKFCPSIRELQ